jgi:hypothetical protein
MIPIVDYNSLIGAAAETLNRDDLVDSIPVWVQLCEEALNNELQVSEIFVEEFPLTWNSDHTPMPPDFKRPHEIKLISSPPGGTLTFVGTDEFRRYQEMMLSGPSRYITVKGSNFYITPPATVNGIVTAVLDYYKLVEPLAGAVGGTNKVLLRYPTLYLYGTLMHSAPYLKNDQRVAVWLGAWTTGLASANGAYDKKRFTQGRLAARRTTFGEGPSKYSSWSSSGGAGSGGGGGGTTPPPNTTGLRTDAAGNVRTTQAGDTRSVE